MPKKSQRSYTAIAFGSRDDFTLVRGRRMPNLTGRLSRWRTKRASVRRRPKVLGAAEQIRTWLSSLLEPRGSIISSDLDRVEEALTLVVDFDGHTGHLAFCSLASWSEVEPRDALADAVQEALHRGADGFDSEFYLSSYAEESYIMGYRSRNDNNY